MFCIDIIYIIESYLSSINDKISFHNINKLTKQCTFNINLYSSRQLPDFIYKHFNIVKIYSTFTDYSNVDKLLTDKLTYMNVSHRHKNNMDILNKISELINLKTFRMFSHKFNDSMFVNLTNLTSLDLGFYQSEEFNGSCLTNMHNLIFLNLGDNFIKSKYVNNLISLKYLHVNTYFKDNDLTMLINLQVLDVSRSKYTLSDSNISTLTNLKLLKCRYSTISSVDHLINLESLHIGLNNVMKSVTNNNLRVLSITDSVVNNINVPNLLELSLNNEITDNILQSHTNLIYLYLGINVKITNDGIKPLTNLKFLHCNFNKNITSYGIYDAAHLMQLHAGLSDIKVNELLHLKKLQYAVRFDSYLESIVLLDNRYIFNG